LRDDPNFDALILALYPDIDKYEEEVIHKLSSCHSLLSWYSCLASLCCSTCPSYSN
jgi:hypothetical protein